jgi:hypothetical protein
MHECNVDTWKEGAYARNAIIALKVAWLVEALCYKPEGQRSDSSYKTNKLRGP